MKYLFIILLFTACKKQIDTEPRLSLEDSGPTGLLTLTCGCGVYFNAQEKVIILPSITQSSGSMECWLREKRLHDSLWARVGLGENKFIN